MYIIKAHYEATESNKNRAGEIHDWYTGKGGFVIGGEDRMPDAREIRQYGYSTLAAASRALKAARENAAWETGLGHWIVSAELIEC